MDFDNFKPGTFRLYKLLINSSNAYKIFYHEDKKLQKKLHKIIKHTYIFISLPSKNISKFPNTIYIYLG